jgi:hypothetical protein
MPKHTQPKHDTGGAALSEAADCRLIIMAGDKGGSGKSTTLACMIEWLQRTHSGMPLAVFDPDARHRSLTKLFGPSGTSPLKSPHHLISCDFDGREGQHLIDDVVRAFAVGEPPARISLVDGVANKFEDTLIRWARNVDLYTLTQEFGFRVTYVLVMNEVSSTFQQAAQLVQEVGNKADYLVVRNCKMTTNLVWDSAAATGLRERVLGELGGCEVTIEGLSADQVKVLDAQSFEVPYTLASLAEGRSQADTFTRNRARSAWERTVKQFGAAAKVILPPSEVLL